MLKGLRVQMLVMAVLPPLFIALVLGMYLSYCHWQDLEELITSKGNALSRQLSINAEKALLNGDITTLQQLNNISLEDTGVRSSVFFTPQGNVLSKAGAQFKISPNISSLTQKSATLQISRNKDFTLFILPVYQAAFTSQIPVNLPAPDKNLIGWLAIEYDHNHIVINQHKNIFIESIIILLALVITACAGLYLSQRIIKDLLKINDNLKTIKEGELITFADIESSEELKKLGQCISDLVSHFKNEIANLKNEFDTLKSDADFNNSNYEMQNIQLQIAIKDAKSANDTKSEFLSNTSHEIRTPLNGIIGFARLLKNTQLNAQQMDYLTTIERSSENLLSIINDILDFSKIEAGKLVLEIAPFNIRHLMEECLHLFAPQAFDKKLEIVLIIYSDVPLLVTGDALRLKQIISNLLNNAVKFTPSGTITLRVSLEHEDEKNIELGISVSDTGIGMSDEQQCTIFQPFTQANTSTSREYGGTGLGLAIVKNLVELMNDEIKVESEKGAGTTFRFVFKTTKDTQQTAISYSGLEGKSILLIEQHPLLQLSIHHILTQWNCRVLSANDYQSAKTVLNEFHADIIITGFNQSNDFNRQNSEIELLSHEPQPLLVIIAANCETYLNKPHKQNFAIAYKPVTEENLFNQITRLIHPHYTHSEKIRMAANMPTQALTLLIVDDNAANLKLIYTLLADKGHSIFTATNGEEAINTCNRQLFDLIFMDIQMPVMNGIDATKHIRQFSTLNNSTPIIAVTAHAMADEKDAILNSGMNEYMTKPINDEQLQLAIQKYSPSNLQQSVDTMMCLKHSSYKPELAIELFNLLVTSLPNDVLSILQAHEKNDFDELLSQVHKLHGACCYTGMPSLKDSAQRLEFAIKNGNTSQYDMLIANLKKASDQVLKWNEKHNIKELLSGE